MKADGVCRARRIGTWFVFAWFLIGGVANFVATDMEIRIVPSYVPWPRAVVLVSGGLELIGPKLPNPRALLSLRLPPEVIASWKSSGPGWQTRMAQVLEKSRPKSRRAAS